MSLSNLFSLPPLISPSSLSVFLSLGGAPLANFGQGGPGSGPLANFGQAAMLASLASGKAPDTSAALTNALLSNQVPGYGMQQGMASAALLAALSGQKAGAKPAAGGDDKAATDAMMPLLLASMSHNSDPNTSAALMAMMSGDKNKQSMMPLMMAAMSNNQPAGAIPAGSANPMNANLLAALFSMKGGADAKAGDKATGMDPMLMASLMGAGGANGMANNPAMMMALMNQGKGADAKAGDKAGGMDPMLMASLMGGAGGSNGMMNNPAMMMALMGQGGGADAKAGGEKDKATDGGMNPLLMAALSGASGGNAFGNNANAPWALAMMNQQNGGASTC